ncbi:hypothetical protein JOD45_000190 [Scopulibacillus daqui]|uniref:Small acid-soluble spore protein P (Minor) n=1 Tax=Scopulibacillus daqui TaxID=1469162 RepID=A0ABS2PX02_9BACL|nr:hypothetical protein [Scopulibacillus daqui]
MDKRKNEKHKQPPDSKKQSERKAKTQEKISRGGA